MLKGLFSAESKSITGTAVVLGAASLVSRVIGLLRDRALAHQFGAGDVLDAYYAAFRIPDFIYNLLILGALSAGFIPVFTRLILKEDKKEAWKVANGALNILAIALGLFCLAAFFLAPTVIPAMVSGFSPEKISLTVELTRYLLLSPILLGLSGVIGGILQSFKNFLAFSVAPILYNLGIIFGAVFLAPTLGPKGLAIGVVVGATAHLAVQLPALYSKGFRHIFVFPWRDKHILKIIELMIPRTLSLAASQINLIIITFLASSLSAGSLSVFNFASNIYHLPIGIIGISFALAALPVFSGLAALGKKKEISERLSGLVRQVLFFIIPLTVLFIALRSQITRVALGSGKFGWEDTILTMNALGLLSISLAFQCLIPLLARVFYSFEDSWSPFIASIITTIFNVAISWFAKEKFGVLGLAAAFSFSSAIHLILLWAPLRVKLKTIQEKEIIISLLKMSLAAFICAVVVQGVKTIVGGAVEMDKFYGVMTQGFAAGSIGILTYILICYLFKLKEVDLLFQSMKKNWLKINHIQEKISENGHID